MCWLARAAITRYLPQTGVLKQQKVIFSQFWRLEVQEQCVGRFGFSGGPSPWLADSCLLSVSSCGLSPVCACPRFSLCVHISSSYKDVGQIGLGSTLMASFKLNLRFKGLISRCSHILRLLGSGFSIGMWEDTVQPIAGGQHSGTNLELLFSEMLRWPRICKSMMFIQ